MLMTTKPMCIHRYLTKCVTTIQPPGMADFIRGTIALFNYSQQYNFKLCLDNTCHPIYAFLQDNDNFINNNSIPVIELLPLLSYATIQECLHNLFNKNETFSIMTNSYYRDDNWGDITPECKQFMQEIFTPTVEFREYIDNVRINFKMPEIYDIIHIRFGDEFLIGNLIMHDNTFYMYSGKIHQILQTYPCRRFILIADSCAIACRLAEQHPALTYWNNSKIHLGSLAHNWSGIDYDNIDMQSICDTLADFFIMSKAQHIHSINGSGFSIACGLIFGIPITQFS